MQALPGAADYLEELEAALLSTFARTNFYEAMSEYLTDAASIGTAVMFVEDDVPNRSVNYSTRHIKECYIAEDRRGRVDTVYRLYPMTNRQIVETWPGADERRRKAAEENPYARGRILHACTPSGGTSSASVYLDYDYRTELETGSFAGFPYLVWRWRKNSDEVYGRGPAADAIQDIIRVNQAAKTLLQAAQRAVDPPLNIPEALKGSERIVPHGYNYYTNPQEIVTPIGLGGSYPLGKDQENEMREQIKDIFRTRIFLLMEQLESGNYTATEVRERQGEKAAVLGATIGRLNSECLVPLIARTYEIGVRNRTMPEPPPALPGVSRIKIDFQGPLAQAQKQYHQSQGVQTALQFSGMMAQLFPESLDNVDSDELMRSGLDAMGSPQKAIREVAARDQIRVARAQANAAQAQAAQQMQEGETIANNAAKLNLPIEPKSMLANIAKQKATQAAKQEKPAPRGIRKAESP